MKLITLHTVVSLAALLVITAGCSHTATPAPAAPAAAESTSNFIVQAQDMATAAAAVTEVGGTITHELRIISAVGATLTPSQVEALKAKAGITVHADRDVSTAPAPPTNDEVQ